VRKEIKNVMQHFSNLNSHGTLSRLSLLVDLDYSSVSLRTSEIMKRLAPNRSNAIDYRS
jgi:hypothetical protein